jgi:hypothetical protein
MSTPNDVVEPTAENKTPRTARITLNAQGARLVLMAQARPDGTGTTYAATTDLSTKKTTRGMTKSHTTFDVAKGEIAKMAVAAEKLGWVRPARKGFTATPDAFNNLPSPKAAPLKAKGK